MKITDLGLNGVKLIEPKVFKDSRGLFLESYNEASFLSHQLPTNFVQDNHSISHRHVLRGLHYQKAPHAQGKLVRVVSGEVLDVVVDIDPSSKTYGKHISVSLDAQNFKMLWVPKHCAHGFLALEENTVFQYKCTNFYNKQAEECILWNDPTINIDWGVENPSISPKDAEGKYFKEINFIES